MTGDVVPEWAQTWGRWPVNPHVFEGPNPHVWMLVVQTPDYGPVIAGIYSTEKRAGEAMARRCREGCPPRIQIMPSVQVDFDLWVS